MTNTILSCSSSSKLTLTVRSQKSNLRIDTAIKNDLQINSARYRFKGFERPILKLQGQEKCLFWNDHSEYYETNLSDLEGSSTGEQALFFDQTPYMFTIQFPSDTEKAQLFSPIALWCDSADWDTESKKLIIPINFGNDLGEFVLCWEWITKSGERKSASFSGQVFSTKLDIYSHFQVMIQEVKTRFDWFQLDLLRQTQWGWSPDAHGESTLKTWLLIFQEVRSSMEERFNKLTERHRQRLVPERKMFKVERMRKVSSRLEEKIVEGLQLNPNRRYPVEKKILNSDTPENRYMKHLLFQTLAQLNSVIDRLEPISKVSDVFKDRLKEWSTDWSMMKEHRFWRGIGSFQGLRKESLVLSQDPIYAGIRRSWFLLQQGLNFLDEDLKGGIQNIAQLYEIWCLVKLEELLMDDAKWRRSGYDEMLNYDTFSNSEDWTVGGEEFSQKAMRFDFYHPELRHVELSLLFQPMASKIPSPHKNVWSGMMAVPVPQNPDIVLRLHRKDLPHQPIYTWIFDAKYRIENDEAPSETLNEMHRYRDAILWQNDAVSTKSLTRESIGAYVLYPGEQNEHRTKVSQIESIEKTNIGAYPLKPDISNAKPHHLKNKLLALLNIDRNDEGVSEMANHYFSAVPQVKTKKTEVYAKCITKSAEKMNTYDYWNNCRLYRLPDKVVEDKELEPEKWSYLIPMSRKGEVLGCFPVLSLSKMKRSYIQKIYHEQGVAMNSAQGKENQEYWLFKLGERRNDESNFQKLPKNKVVEVME